MVHNTYARMHIESLKFFIETDVHFNGVIE